MQGEVGVALEGVCGWVLHGSGETSVKKEKEKKAELRLKKKRSRAILINDGSCVSFFYHVT